MFEKGEGVRDIRTWSNGMSDEDKRYAIDQFNAYCGLIGHKYHDHTPIRRAECAQCDGLVVGIPAAAVGTQDCLCPACVVAGRIVQKMNKEGGMSIPPQPIAAEHRQGSD